MHNADDEADKKQEEEDVNAAAMGLPKLLNYILELLIGHDQILVDIVHLLVEGVNLLARLVDGLSHLNGFDLPLLSLVDQLPDLLVNFFIILFPSVHGLHLELGSRFIILFPYPLCPLFLGSWSVIKQPRPDVGYGQVNFSFAWTPCCIRRLHQFLIV